MKKIASVCVFLVILTFILPLRSGAASLPLTQRLNGRILLQVESYGRAWYVNPADASRYYLKDGQTAYDLMRGLSLGITNADLAKIPTIMSEQKNDALVKRLSGRLLLQVEAHGECWYVNPTDGLRYYLKDGAAAFELMRNFGLGIKDADLKTIPINAKQIVFDATFDDIAYVLLRDGEVIKSQHQNQILPLASLSKLMTALVLFDQPNLDWNKEITISETTLAYPTTMVGDDTTSEIDLELGDIVTVYDLWVAMLVASSNQAAIALVDSSGLSRAEFIAAMNDKAKTLGLVRTQFFDPTGLSAHNVTTAYEMALIAKVAFARPEILNAAKQNNYVINTHQFPERAIKVTNRNYSLQSYGVDAAKTGYLVEAKVCVALKKASDIIVILHAPHISDRNKILDKLIVK